MHTSPTPTAGRSGDPAIELRHLVKSFRPLRGSADTEVTAVDGIDLTVGHGEVVAFLGPNGAGKTTTLDMVLGLTEPTSGTARVFGRPPRHAVVAGEVSAVLQTGGLLRDLTVRETVRMIASTYAATTPVDEVIDRAGLAALAHRRVSKCSGGEQQRLRFALALLPDPRLLILDEPTAGMDVSAHHDEAIAPISASLLRLDGVRTVTSRGERLVVVTSNSDGVARLLLSEQGVRDLEITSAGLEEAFMALTGRTVAEPESTGPPDGIPARVGADPEEVAR